MYEQSRMTKMRGLNLHRAGFGIFLGLWAIHEPDFVARVLNGPDLCLFILVKHFNTGGIYILKLGFAWA